MSFVEQGMSFAGNVLKQGVIPKIIQYESKKIISCGWDETIKIWNLDKFSCEDTINNVGDKLINITLLKDKITLGVVLNYGNIKLLNLKTKETLLILNGNYFIYELNDHRIVTIFHETYFSNIYFSIFFNKT